MIHRKKRNITSPLVAFTEPPMIASATGDAPVYLDLGGGRSTPDDYAGSSGNSGSNAVGILDSIFGGLSSVFNAGSNLIGTWFGRSTEVVDTNQKSGMSTGVLLLGAVLVIILIIFLMKKQ